MRDLFENLGRDYAGFLEQRNDLIHLTACSDNDTALALKVLSDLDRSNATDLFLLFAGEFRDSASYVKASLVQFREQHRLATEARERAGEPSLPPWPEAAFSDRRLPHERLHSAINFARSLLPPAGGHRLIWAMFPTRIERNPEYLALISSCAPRTRIEPWMRGVRLIFRVEAGFSVASSPLADAGRTRLTRCDFGPAAMQASLRRSAEDERLPEAERMVSLLQLALIDSAHKRYDEANARFRVLLDYYRRIDQPVMLAVVMNGIGETARRRGNTAEATEWFNRALTPASQAEQPAVLAPVVQNLAGIAYEQKRYDDAEAYFDALVILKNAMLDEEGKVEALEWRGLTQEKRKRYDRAVRSWEEAALLIHAFKLEHRLKPIEQHLRRAYQALRMNDRLKALEGERRHRLAKAS